MKRRAANFELGMGTSFLDVLSNTIGGLAFLLIVAFLMVGVMTPPRIVTEKLPDANDGENYQAWLAAREGGGRYEWTLAEGALPPGLEIESSTGRLSGTPSIPAGAGASGTYRFTIRCNVQDEKPDQAELRDTRSFELTVFRGGKVNVMPLRITTQPNLPPAIAGVAYPLTFAAEGGQSPYSWSAPSDLPAGFSLLPDGRVEGQAAAPGSHEFEVVVAAANGFTADRHFLLEVQSKWEKCPDIPPLEVVTSVIPDAVARRDYSIVPAASGGVPPYRWSAVGAPPWLATRQGAVFGGSPTLQDIGESWVVWRATDSAGNSAESVPVQVRVLPPVIEKPEPLVLATESLPDARVGTPYELAYAVRGGIPPYRFELESESRLAAGVNFDAPAGLLRGTPQATGLASIGVRVSDAGGSTQRARMELRVRPALEPVEILTSGTSDSRVGTPVSLALAATGGFPPYRWSQTSGSLPPGLAITEAGIVSGTPERAGDWSMQATVADAEGSAAPAPLELAFRVLTEKDVTLLRMTTSAMPLMVAGRDAVAALSAEGGAAPYRWNVGGSLPDGLSLRGNEIAGVPAAPGVTDFELVVEDATGQTASGRFRLEVRRLVAWQMFLVAAILAGLLLLLAAWLLTRLRRLMPAPLEILTREIPGARASFPYSVQLACTGGVAPYRWKLADGELPVGLELTHDGRIEGKPMEGITVEETQEVRFVVEVEDGRGQRARQEL